MQIFLYIVFCTILFVGGEKIDGMWNNHIGSHMFIEQLPQSPIVNGYYNSSVGGAKGTYPLNGLITTINENQQIVTFCVVWQNQIADFMSGTCWTCTFDLKQDSITGMWILRKQSYNEWNSTTVGVDIFKRSK